MMTRLVTLCLDVGCIKACEIYHITGCVLADVGLHILHQKYHFMTWLKTEILMQALTVAEEVFFFDVDILLLKNPWRCNAFQPTFDAENAGGSVMDMAGEQRNAPKQLKVADVDFNSHDLENLVPQYNQDIIDEFKAVASITTKGIALRLKTDYRGLRVPSSMLTITQ